MEDEQEDTEKEKRKGMSIANTVEPNFFGQFFNRNIFPVVMERIAEDILLVVFVIKVIHYCLTLAEILKPSFIVAVVEKQKSAKPVKPGLGIAAEEPRARKRSPSPARNAISCIVHVIGLVRPYTLGQLKELLNRTGSVTEDGFWIDKIKSHCYAVVSELP